MKVLVTGGAGYIGSHFTNYINKQDFEITVLDNLSRGHIEALPAKVTFIKADIKNLEELKEKLTDKKFDALIHFAALAYVGESVQIPHIYYLNNTAGSINLINTLIHAGLKYIIFSSTCSVYGNPSTVPITESETVSPINPYANTKFLTESFIRDIEQSSGIKSVILRYFNAAGADFKGNIGESHSPETHLIPLVIETGFGKRKIINVFGDDYNTSDGTCVRDYIHVNDIADAHLKALDYLRKGGKSEIVNIGTGKGNSVIEVINKTSEILGKKINYSIEPRREGDPAILVADNKKALKILGWQPKYDINEIIKSAVRWHKNQKY